jgi:hypothetical protein
VGDECFDRLVEHLDAVKIAEFERPGDFYDFVSYRERSFTYIDDTGIRKTDYPNSTVYYVKRAEPLNDLVLLSLLEPTHFGEIWADRVVSLLKTLSVSRYEVLGAMGSPVPHTRPIRITGRSSDPEIAGKLKGLGVRQTLGRQYQGPTSIFNSISMKLQDEGITSVNLMAHMPSHISLQEPDFSGVYSVLRVIKELEGIDIPLDGLRTKGRRQYERVGREVRHSQSLMELSKQLEEIYDQEEGPAGEEEPSEPVELPPNIQKAIDEALGRE